MPFPNLEKAVNLLGHRMKDRITGMTGVVTSMCFDLYGCVQAALHPGLDKDGKIAEQHWFDVARLEKVGESRVMTHPAFGDADPLSYDSGPTDKPKPRAV